MCTMATSAALNALEQQGVIRADRGSIKMLDREGLEETANGTYGVAEAEYERRMK